MKKSILLILTFLFSSFGIAQELVVNGNFESGVSPWVGNAANVVTESGNSYNAADVTTAGNPWDVNLSQVLSLTSGKTYTFKFDAWSDRSRTLIAGIGLNEAPYSASTQTLNLTTSSQTFTLTLTAPATSANSRVIFDMGAAVGFVGIDNVSLVEVVATCNDGIQNGDETGIDCGGSCAPCAASPGPTVAAPTPPARPASQVISIFSDAYTNVTVTEWGPNWGPSSARITDYSAGGNAAKLIDINAGQVFAGIDFASSAFDATPFTYFHIDYYIPSPIPAGQVMNVKLSNHAGGAGETSAIQYTIIPSQAGQWVSMDIPLADFVAASDPANLARNAIAQIVISAARADNNLPVDIYFDNMYFHMNTLGVNDVNVNSLKVYPNPVNSGETFTVSADVKSVEIYSVSGQLVKKAATRSVSTAGLSKGIYILKVTDKGGVTHRSKLMIK